MWPSPRIVHGPWGRAASATTNASPWLGRSLLAITIRYVGPTLMTPGARPQDAVVKTGLAAARDEPKPLPSQYRTEPVALPTVRMRMTSHGAERKLLPRLETASMKSGAPSMKVGGSTRVILGPIFPPTASLQRSGRMAGSTVGGRGCEHGLLDQAG